MSPRILLCTCLIALTAPLSWAAQSTTIGLTGTVTAPSVYGLAELEALPAITQTVSYTAAGVPQTRTYTGTPLWGLIQSAGLISPPGNNGLLNQYVLATGTDGYKVVFSLGDLNPLFGNRPDLVAYEEITAGVPGPITADGFARLTAPGDIRGGRYVSNLYSLDVRNSGSTVTVAGGGLSSSFSVSGSVVSGRSFDLAALQALPSVTRVVGGVSYTGVSFWDLLNTTVGISVTPGVNNDLLGKYVVATGSDGYKSVFSMGELSANVGNQPNLIAFDADGAGLSSNGFARLVVPNDDRRGRWVSNLVSLEVLSASPVPEPAAWLLWAAGAAAVSLRVKRCASTSQTPRQHLA